MSLLERFTKGDLDAFETLFRQFQGRVYGWVMRIVRDPGIAEDLTLETFWRIYRARERLDVQADFAAWAYRIAINLALTHIQRRRPEEELPPDVPQAPGPNPALRREELEQIRRAFGRLPDKLRTAAAMALIDERPYAEISQLLGIAPGTVKSRVFRAVRILRKHLNHMGVTR
jgi:RNA polymerase sigma-70 factor (ECF subfamily)